MHDEIKELDEITYQIGLEMQKDGKSNDEIRKAQVGVIKKYYDCPPFARSYFLNLLRFRSFLKED